MEAEGRTIRDLSVEEREEVFADVVKLLEGAAREALVQGDRRYAALSSNMADAIFINADELARDQLGAAERVLEQAAAMLSQFRAAHPYPMVSTAIH